MSRRVAIVIPVLDDWECLSRLSRELQAALAPAGWEPVVVVVDDGSRPGPGATAAEGAGTVLRLTRNVGHQRAIAIGLDYVVQEIEAEAVAVMDSDGEDRPADLPGMLAALDRQDGRVVVATRRRRQESRHFVASYRVYKALFRVLTGERLDFGNFSVMGRDAAVRLTAMHELWLNIPATVMRSRLAVLRLPTDRGVRYAGRSRMNLVGLVTHGMSAVGVFVERAFTRVLLTVGLLAVALLVGFGVALLLKLFGLATPGWVTTIAVALVLILVQAAMIALCGLLMVFGQAANVALPPAAVARSLVARVDRPAVAATDPADGCARAAALDVFAGRP